MTISAASSPAPCSLFGDADALLKSDFDAVGQQVILPQQVVFLNLCEEGGIVFLAN